MQPIQNFIGGEFHNPIDDQWLDNVDPATGTVYSHVPDSSAADVELAVQHAQQAFAKWSGMEGAERARALETLADWIAAHATELAEAESRDSGKTIRQARVVEIPRAETNFRFFAALGATIASECHPMSHALNYTLRQPLGVVGCISPWNLPLYLFTWKIAPALAAGNCVVAKPSELTPMTAFMLAQGVQQCLPPGVLNIVQGSGQRCGDAIVGHRGIKAISFTGGSKTGAVIAARTATMFKKTSLELGGKNPNIIFADCDFDDMLENTVRSSFANQGQICLCGSRIYVQRQLFPKFRDAFIDRTAKLNLQDPLQESSEVGAVVSQAHMNKILGCIDQARAEGGSVLTGGGRAKLGGRCADGFFVQPTVIEGLDANCRTNQEEIFGPVVTIEPFEDAAHAVHLANATSYGLSASIWTQDVDTAHQVARVLDAGVVWVNCWLIRDLRTPFGGVKQSGVGREGGLEAMRFFTESKNICVKYSH